MINVDVYVPAMNQAYNLNLDEKVRISLLIREISELICKKEHSRLDGESALFTMGSIDRSINFNSRFCLRDYSVKTGDRLILV